MEYFHRDRHYAFLPRVQNEMNSAFSSQSLDEEQLLILSTELAYLYPKQSGLIEHRDRDIVGTDQKYAIRTTFIANKTKF